MILSFLLGLFVGFLFLGLSWMKARRIGFREGIQEGFKKGLSMNRRNMVKKSK